MCEDVTEEIAKVLLQNESISNWDKNVSNLQCGGNYSAKSLR